MDTIDVTFKTFSYLEVQFRENSMQGILIRKTILRNTCVFNLKFMEITITKHLKQDILSNLRP